MESTAPAENQIPATTGSTGADPNGKKQKGVVYKAKGEYDYSAETLTVPTPGPG